MTELPALRDSSGEAYLQHLLAANGENRILRGVVVYKNAPFEIRLGWSAVVTYEGNRAGGGT